MYTYKKIQPQYNKYKTISFINHAKDQEKKKNLNSRKKLKRKSIKITENVVQNQEKKHNDINIYNKTQSK